MWLAGREGTEPVPVHDLLDPSAFTLLTLDDADEWQLLAKHSEAPLDVVSLREHRPLDPAWLDVLPFATHRGVLVRPDGHVAAHVSAPDESGIAPTLAALRGYQHEGALFAPAG